MTRSAVFLGRSSVSRFVTFALACGVSVSFVDCMDSRSREALPGPPPPGPCDDVVEPEPVNVTVSVELGAERATVPPVAYGMHASVYDNALHHPELRSLLHESGIALLRYPGGGYAEMYHWSTHEMSETPDDDGDGEPERGYLARGSDFGAFVGIVEHFGGAMMITVNYGSNLQGDGPGEPKEAAAWVAYANGDPADERVIGVDGAGNDWMTVGYWATLRASQKLSVEDDDGFNHLRIEHPQPLGIEYWEIGNEVFGNGYNEANMDPGFAYDLHVPYDETRRYQNELLSGTTYGKGVVAYHDEMKAVDPTIRIGAVLGTPPVDDAWGVEWNDKVLRESGSVIDFAIVHWYPSPPELPQFLSSARRTIPTMESRLRQSLETHAGDRAGDIELVMTEVGPGIPPRDAALASGAANRSQAIGLFALDTYLGLIEHGFTNIDWLELHNGTFLSEAPHDVTHRKGPAYNGIRMAYLLAGPGDRLVTATTDTPTLVVHAAVRADGKVGVLLSNTQAPEQSRAIVTVNVTGGSVESSGERWEYLPNPSQAPVSPDGGTVECRILHGANGTVMGPIPFFDAESPVEVPPYGVVLLLFDAPR